MGWIKIKNIGMDRNFMNRFYLNKYFFYNNSDFKKRITVFV
jgi:hypothetical protein